MRPYMLPGLVGHCRISCQQYIKNLEGQCTFHMKAASVVDTFPAFQLPFFSEVGENVWTTSSCLVYNMLLAFVAVVVSIFKMQAWGTVIQESFIQYKCGNIGKSAYMQPFCVISRRTCTKSQQADSSSFALNWMPGPVPYCLWPYQLRLPIV